MNIDDFNFDEDDLKPQNKITEAYGALFDNIITIATNGKASAEIGDSKTIIHTINVLANKIASLTNLTRLDIKVTGANGVVYNTFGVELDDEDDEEENAQFMTDAELTEKINSIIDETKILDFSTVMDIIKMNEEKNETDNGEDMSKYTGAEW